MFSVVFAAKNYKWIVNVGQVLYYSELVTNFLLKYIIIIRYFTVGFTVCKVCVLHKHYIQHMMRAILFKFDNI